MKKLFISLTFLTLISSYSSALTIHCGDVSKTYVDFSLKQEAMDRNLDLNAAFQEDYYTDELIKNYEDEGYEYHVAGRNCFKDYWDQDTLLNQYGDNRYEQEFMVLFMYESARRFDWFNLGPLTPMKTGTLEISGISYEQSIEQDIILTGDSADSLSTTDGEISADLKLERGKGKVKVIIRKRIKE